MRVDRRHFDWGQNEGAPTAALIRMKEQGKGSGEIAKEITRLFRVTISGGAVLAKLATIRKQSR